MLLHDFFCFFVSYCLVYFCQGKLLQSHKNSRKFQTSVTERYTSPSKCSGIFRQNLLKVPVKKLNL